MRRAGVIASLAAILVSLTPRPAFACSCASLDLREGLRMFDGAFVGEFISRRGWVHSPTNTFTFRVERVLKGDIGEVIEVESSSSGASCGLEVEEGERIGLFVEGGENAWWSGRCMDADPDLLIEAAGPLPAPDGRGAVQFLVGVDSAGYRMLALDGAGRTLAYGPGDGRVDRISLCPEARMAVEVVSEEWPSEGYRVAVRHLDTFIATREVPLPDPEVDVWDVSCRDPTAQDVLVLVSDWPEGSDRGRLLRLTPDGVDEVTDLSMRFGGLTEGGVFVMTPRWKLLEVDARSGKRTELARLPRHTWSFEMSPDHKHVAGVVSRHGARPGDRPSRVFVRDLDEDGSIVFASLGGAGVAGTFEWVDATTLAFFAWGGRASTDDLLLYDVSLNAIGRIPEWRASEGVVVDGVLYSIRSGQLVAATLPDGFPDWVRNFHSPSVGALVHVPGGPEAAPGATQAGDSAPASNSPWGLVVAVVLGAVALLGMQRATNAARSLGAPSKRMGSLPE
jgi:hypothetical protein